MIQILFLIFAHLNSSASDQIPPLQVIEGEKCHINDARPLLEKSNYQKDSDYKFETLEKSPVKILESIKLNDGETLKIEQRGCEDVYFKFNLETKAKKSEIDQILHLSE